MREKKKAKLIAISKDAKYAHRLWTNWFIAPAAVISVLEIIHLMGVNIIPIWEEIIPDGYYPYVMATLTTLGFITRHLKQRCLSHPEDGHDSESDQTTA